MARSTGPRSKPDPVLSRLLRDQVRARVEEAQAHQEAAAAILIELRALLKGPVAADG